jgi:hypothetical protein
LDENCDNITGYRCFNIFDEFDTCEEEDCNIACGYEYGGGIGLVKDCENCFPAIVPPDLCNCEDEDEWPEIIYFPYKCVNCKYYEDAFMEDSPLSPTAHCARASFQITSGTDFGAPVFDGVWTWAGGTGGYGGFGINNRFGKTPCPEDHPITSLPLALVEYCGCTGCTSPPIPISGEIPPAEGGGPSISFTAIGVNLCSDE